MKKTYFILALFALCFSTYNDNSTYAYGECSEYGIMASYDFLTGKCKCMSGYVFGEDFLGETTCVSGASYCRDLYGFNSEYDSLASSCKCSRGYYFAEGLFGTTCESKKNYCEDLYGISADYDSLGDQCECEYGYELSQKSYGDGLECRSCFSKYGLHSSYNSLTESCECDDDYTLDEDGQCVEKQNNAYFFLKELNTDENLALVESDYSGSTYLITYGSGCYDFSFDNYLGSNIVINLGTDVYLDTFDKVVLQDDNEVCDILSVREVSSYFTLEEEPEEEDIEPTPAIDFSSFLTPNLIFSDVGNSHPNKTAIEYLKTNNVISGYPDGTFHPENPVNRVELLKILIESKENSFNPSENDKNCFTDIPAGQWFTPYVCYSKDKNWVSGYQDNTFQPSQTVSKAEAVKIILNAFGFSLPAQATTTPFLDINLSDWFAPYIELAKEKGFLEENSDYYEPNNGMTRAGVSELIYRVLLHNSGSGI